MDDEKKSNEESQQGNENALQSLTQVVDRLEKANKEKEALLKKEEELYAKRLLGGVTDNVPKQEIKKEETPQEYAKRILKGQV